MLNDTAVWFDAYKQIYYAEYENQDEDDWYSDRKGSTEYEFTLTDEGGDVVMSEWHWWGKNLPLKL